DRKIWLKSLPPKDEGIEGVNFAAGDVYSGNLCEFPTPETPDRIFSGVPFKTLPVLHICVTRNNTKYHLNDSDGNKLMRRSCGLEGFKNCRKGTNVAAKTTAMTISKLMQQQGIKTLRVCISGLGPGRMASIEGLVAGGMEIVSISDTTNFTENPPRPRKARRL
ncbi:hypothetical protein B4U79_13057, partial [Dinothrombium tinctorium]